MLKLLNNYRKKDVLYIVIAVILIAGQVYLELKMPDYMSEITKLVQTSGSPFDGILTNGLMMILCAFASLVFAVLTTYFIANTAASFSFNIRKKIFNKVTSLDIQNVNSFSTSSLITRTTNDITQIQMLLAMGLHLMIKSPITAIWAISKILNKSWQWSMLTVLAVVILLTTIGILLLIVLPKFKKVQQLTDKLNGVTRENLTGIRVIRAFNAEKYQEDKFDEANANLTNTQMFTQKAFSLMQPIMYLVLYFLTLFIYVIGAKLIDGAMMSDKISIFGDMIVFSSYAMQIIISFLLLAFVFVMLPRAQVSAKRINEVLKTKDKMIDGKITKSSVEGVVEFKNVSFKYDSANDYLLKDISFKAKKGETIAFVGSTGSGKTTLVNLIPRFYDATDGEVLVNNINVKDYKQEYLHNIIGYIPQKSIMFKGSIKSNIKYGNRNVDDKDIINSCEIAQASDFIESMDKKYDYEIAQGGTNVSGGQKQRLSIARVIARKPEIYIFDDSFSALDYKTDAKLRKELRKYTKDATILIVAQRIGTIINADKIIVLDEGKCVGIGKHEELLKNCEVYKQIAYSQLSKEELEHA